MDTLTVKIGDKVKLTKGVYFNAAPLYKDGPKLYFKEGSVAEVLEVDPEDSKELTVFVEFSPNLKTWLYTREYEVIPN